MGRRSASIILGAILLVCTAGVYLPARHFQFVDWDDYNEVTENPLMHPATGEHLREIWTGPYLRLYAPLSYTVWWGMSRVSEIADNPAWFHLLNVVLHLACAGLVFSILRVCVKSPVAAFGGATFFALHPMQVESVAWVAEMNNLLTAALSLAAIRLFLAHGQSTAKSGWILYGLASLAFLLALFAKPTAVVAPAIAAILEIGFMRKPWRPAMGALLPWFLAAGVFAWTAHQSQQGFRTWVSERPIAALDALAFYWQKILWPGQLSIDYARTPGSVAADYGWVVSAAAVAALATIVLLLRQTYPGLGLGLLVMVAGLLPVLGFVPFAFQEFSTVADHLVYVAMLGPALAAATLLAEIRWARALGIVAVLGLALTWLSAAQLQTWRDSDALAKHTLAIDPGSAIGNMIAGATLDRAGRPAEAVAHFAAAVARIPNEPDFHYNLANALRDSGEYEKAVDEYQRAIGLSNSPMLNAMNNLGVTYARLGRIVLARVMFSRVLEIDPSNSQAIENMRILGGQ